jgi:hypothetical protein
MTSTVAAEATPVPLEPPEAAAVPAVEPEFWLHAVSESASAVTPSSANRIERVMVPPARERAVVRFLIR